MKDEYTFVTLDNDMVTTGDAVFVDIDESVNAEVDFVTIDEAFVHFDGAADNHADFITMDDMDMVVNDMDIDSYMSDICEADVSIIL